MKKLIIIVVILILILIIGITTTFATDTNIKNKRKNYIDENNDGICDYYGSKNNETSNPIKKYNCIEDNKKNNDCIKLKENKCFGKRNFQRYNQ